MYVEFVTKGRRVVNYAVVLLLATLDGVQTIRVYDGAHGRNEMHRYGEMVGKQPPEVFHRGTLGAGMRAAIDEVTRGYDSMIEGWLGR